MNRNLLKAVLLGLLLASALPVLAQDTVPIPTEATVPAWVALVVSLAGIIVSAIASGGTVWMIVNRAIDKTRNDPVAMKNAEEAAAGVPQRVALALIDVLKTLRNAADLGVELLDGVPASEKVVGYSSDDLNHIQSMHPVHDNIRQIGFGSHYYPPAWRSGMSDLEQRE